MDTKYKYEKYKKKYLNLKSKRQTGGQQSTWMNKDAEKKLMELTEIFGNPDIYSEKEQGIAIWLNKSLVGKDFKYGKNCFEEIIIRDELIKHLCPSEHYDYLYSYIKIPIYPPSKLSGVLSLSGSVGYDPLKKTLYARCASLEANIVTLKIATDIIIGTEKTVVLPDNRKVTYSNINDVHVSGAYGLMIAATGSENAEEYTKNLYTSLCDNITQIRDISKDNITEGYWPAAFSVKNNTCYPPDKADKICHGSDKAAKTNKAASTQGGKKDKPDKSSAYGGKKDKSANEFIQ